MRRKGIPFILSYINIISVKKAPLLLLLVYAITAQSQNWTNNFFPGQNDANGKYLGGTETMNLVPHKGKLYAAMSYVGDLNNATYTLSGGTPILVLDSAEAAWKQDVLFAAIILVPSMKEIVFTKDYTGNSVAPDTLLIAGPNNNQKHIFIYVKDDVTGGWIKDSITTLTANVEIRSMTLHNDPVTGHQYILIGVSNFGIWKGEYNASLPGKIQWESVPEFTIPANTRVMAFAEVNGELYAGTTESTSGTSKILRRVDGTVPSYSTIWEDTAPGMDIRGFTPIKNPIGTSENLWFYYNNFFRRLSPQDNDTIINELDVSASLSQQTGRVFSENITAGFNDHQFFYHDAASGDSTMLIGLQAKYDSLWLLSNPFPNIGGRTTDGIYFSRIQNASGVSYALHFIVNNSPIETDTLLATRAFCLSPFAADNQKFIYACGFNGNGIPSTNTAWIYRGDFTDVATSGSPPHDENFSIAVYPNPAHGSFTLEGDWQQADLYISDLSGRNVFEQRNIPGSSEIDCANFRNGIYFLHLMRAGKLSGVIKLVVQNQ